jgi:hypothetical protein
VRQQGVGRHFTCVEGAVVGGVLVAEVDATEELPDEHEIDPGHAVGLEGTDLLGYARDSSGGAEVGEEVEVAA